MAQTGNSDPRTTKNVRVYENVHRRLKIYCAHAGENMNHVATEAVIRELDRLEREQPTADRAA